MICPLHLLVSKVGEFLSSRSQNYAEIMIFIVAELRGIECWCVILSLMKIIVTHASPDWDAIGSVWLLKKYLPGWSDAIVEFVPAGQRSARSKITGEEQIDPIEILGDMELVHVDTGMGPLDHHQIYDMNVCGASRVWDYVKEQRAHSKSSGSTKSIEQREETDKERAREEAVDRIVKVVVEMDHFQEVFWADPAADYQEFSLLGVLDGLKLYKMDQDAYYVEFGIICLEALQHRFENRIWAEKEIASNSIKFETKWGDGLGFESLNDDVLKLAQKMGYRIVIRKDPRKGYVRIKGMPVKNIQYPISNSQISNGEQKEKEKEIDFTLVYENLKKIDPEATWYLHVSKKMLLNGTPKNPKMIPTKLSLPQIVEVLKNA